VPFGGAVSKLQWYHVKVLNNIVNDKNNIKNIIRILYANTILFDTLPGT